MTATPNHPDAIALLKPPIDRGKNGHKLEGMYDEAKGS